MTTLSRGHRIGALLAALALLAVAWLAALPSPTPPLYDGVAFPDEPYRYVTPPSGAPRTPPPGAAVADARIVGGKSQLALAGSNEQGPQVQFVIDDGEITAPPGATVVHLRAEPVATTSQPSDAKIWGNVYRLTATTDQGTAQIHVGSNSTTAIILRAPVGPTPQPVMEYTDGTTWRRLPITRVGNDIYSAPLVAAGDYAVATLPGQPQPVAGTTPTTGSRPGIDRWILIPGIALVVLIAAVAAIRWTNGVSRRLAADMVDVDALLSYARMVAAAAASMDLPAEQQADLQARAEQLQQAAGTAPPDPLRARRLAEELLGSLRASNPTLAGQAAIAKGEQALRLRRG